jgi:hypothetical protein
MRYSYVIVILIFIGNSIVAQEKKSAEALYITTPLIIDGVLNEPCYNQVQPAKDFTQIEPYNGKPSFQPSEVYLFYDQKAIYVGAMLYDSSPDSIFNFYSERDDIGMSDYFGVYFDPYNQGQLAYGFFITPAGVQTDLKAVKKEYDYEDGNWDAVWLSKTRITDKGWVVEMRIPYSALRFPEKEVHTWGINMFRNIRRYNSNNSWNFLDRKIAGFIHQEGTLTGIKNIKPPIRLSLSPYVATYLEFKSGKSNPDFVYKGGMDLKYGLSESFTMDMMLIPDFGQIQSDDKQLNLTPYELYYNEKRQFFNEGTELFQRGSIFYSRRIGASPKFEDRADNALHENEVVDYGPSETQLANATKVSGRTTDGWGLGFLNAMSLPSYAKLKDTITGTTRNILVQPFTNYNVCVIDKSLKNNSYISLINSNMWVYDDPFRANVTATEFQIRDKSKIYAITGKAGVSIRGDTTKETGYYTRLAFDKNGGNLHLGILQDIYSDKYNPNDLGYLYRNNELMTESYIYYQVIEPFWIIREWNGNIWCDYYRIYNPNTNFNTEIGLNTYALFKNNYWMSLNGGIGTDKHDYYETRVKDRYFAEPHYNFYNINLNTDQRKSVSLYLHYGGAGHPTTDQIQNWGDASLNARIGHRLQLNYSLSFNNNINNRGFVDKTDNEDTIYFAKRNINTISNVVDASYALTNRASFRLRIRHYWSGAKNKIYYQLQHDGSLTEDPAYRDNHDENYNAFTIDMIFRWIFAPGSEMSLGWKNSINTDQDIVNTDYWRNLDNTWNGDQANSLSFRILYYIDYNSLTKKKSL